MSAIYDLLGITKQAHWAYVKRQAELAQKNALLLRAIHELRRIHPRMSGRKLYHLLQPDFLGRDRFYALMAENGLNLSVKTNAARTTFSVKCWQFTNLCVEIELLAPNQLWVSDISYYSIGDRFFYFNLIMDVYSRMILGFNVADHMRATSNLKSLESALKFRGVEHYNNRLIHHSDRGSQYASDLYTDKLQSKGIRISMCATVYENTHIERLNGTIKNEYLRPFAPKNFNALQRALKRAVKLYNEDRPHRSLDMLSPAQFEQKLKKTPIIKRVPMRIYTDSLSQRKAKLRNQMNLFKP